MTRQRPAKRPDAWMWFDQGIDHTPSSNIKGNEITGMLSGTEITFRRVGRSS